MPRRSRRANLQRLLQPIVRTLACCAIAAGTFAVGTTTTVGPAAAQGSPCLGASPPPHLDVSTEQRAATYRLYCATFLRTPDSEGMDYWVEALRNRRLTAQRVAAEFIVSPEFVARYGPLDNPSFVELIYRNAMGRTADAAGRAYWNSLLDSPGFDRDDLVLAFSDSPEFRTRTDTDRALPSELARLETTAPTDVARFLPAGLTARQAADRELALGTYVADQCALDIYGGNVRWTRPGWNLTWCIRTHPGWDRATTDAVYVHEAIHVRVSLLYVHRAALTPTQRAEVERVVFDHAAKEGSADFWAMRYVPGYAGAPHYADWLFTNDIWDELFTLYPIGGPLPTTA